jgi:hypothetical protein
VNPAVSPADLRALGEIANSGSGRVPLATAERLEAKGLVELRVWHRQRGGWMVRVNAAGRAALAARARRQSDGLPEQGPKEMRLMASAWCRTSDERIAAEKAESLCRHIMEQVEKRQYINAAHAAAQLAATLLSAFTAVQHSGGA